MSEMSELKDYLISLGASKVGFADVNGLASEFVDLPNGISLVLKIPKETVPFFLMRPISGSGSLAMATDLFKTHGTDSFIGRVISVVMGSSETTFYAITVYFGYIGIKNTRHTLKCALISDVVAFMLSIFVCSCFFN
jgi:spore maturation protein B